MVSGMLYVVVTVLAGWAWLTGWGDWRERRWLGFLGLAAVLGQGLVGLLSFWLSLAGMVPGRVPLAAMGVVAAGLALRWRKRCPANLEDVEKLRGDPVSWAAVAVVVVALALVAARLVLMPITAWDSFAIWGLKAKVVLAEPVLHAGYFHDLSLSYSHLDYPLLVPFLLANGMAAAGAGAPGAWGLVLVVQAAGLALYMQDRGRDFLPSRQAWLLSAVLVALPVAVEQAGAMTADFTFSVLLLVTVSALWRWWETGERGELATAGLAAASLIFTKNEGLVAAVVVGVVACCRASFDGRTPSRRSLALAGGVVMAASLPWLVWRLGLPRTHEDYGGRLSLGLIVEHLPRTGKILWAATGELLRFSRWGLCVVLVGVALWAGRRGWRSWRQSGPAAIVAGLGLAYAVALMVSPWQLENLLPAVTGRLLLHLTPLTFLWIAVCLGERTRLEAGATPGAGE